MVNSFYISPEPEDGGNSSQGSGSQSSGGGPDDAGNFTIKALKLHGFVSLVFGLALGFTLVLLSLTLRCDWLATPELLRPLVSKTWTDLWLLFVVGFAGGSLFAGLYNLLLFRRIDLLGLDRSVN